MDLIPSLSLSLCLSKRNKIKAHELIDHLGGELFPPPADFDFSIGQGQVMTREARWQGVGREGKSTDHEEPLGHQTSTRAFCIDVVGVLFKK